jgi:hypothetical protein
MSITGLTIIFAGAFWPIVGMGTALELGKLSAVAALGQRIGGWPLRCILVAMVAALLAVNTAGVFGYLSRANLAHRAATEAVTAAKMAKVNASITVQAALVTDFDRRLEQLDAMVTAATRRGRITSALSLIGDTRRDALVERRQAAAGKLAELEAERADIEAEDRAVEDTGRGPILYLAALIGTAPENVTRWAVLVIACILDPFAIALLYVATARSSPR